MWFVLEKDLDASYWNERFSCYFPWFANEKRQTMEIGCSHSPNGLSHKSTIDVWMDGHLGMSTYAPYQMDIQRFFSVASMGAYMSSNKQNGFQLSNKFFTNWINQINFRFNLLSSHSKETLVNVLKTSLTYFKFNIFIWKCLEVRKLCSMEIHRVRI